MKSLLLSVLIALSVGLNLLLIVGLASPDTIAPLVNRIRPQSSESAGRTSSANGRTAKQASSSAGAQSNALPSWSALDSDDLATLVANLRNAGFDDETIRAILRAKLGKRIQEREDEMMGSAEPTPYWQPRRSLISSLYNDPDTRAEIRQMTQDMTKTIESLLGPDPRASMGLAAMMQKVRFGDLPPDKIEMLNLITSDYSDLTSAITLAAQGIYLPEDREKLQYLNQEKDKDIRALLTPEEYQTYQLRSSNTANTMRINLIAFQPTEEEFLKIYALQSAFDQQYNPGFPGGMTPLLAQERANAQRALTAQIEEALGPERAADYVKATDYTYRQAVALVNKLNLPPASADQLWTMQKDFQQKASQARMAGRGGSPTEVNATLFSLQQEATTQALNLLGGPDGLEAYKQNGGQWIDNLVPRQATGPGSSSSPTINLRQ